MLEAGLVEVVRIGPDEDAGRVDAEDEVQIARAERVARADEGERLGGEDEEGEGGGEERERNWIALPAGDFFVALRLYNPADDSVNAPQTARLPEIVRERCA